MKKALLLFTIWCFFLTSITGPNLVFAQDFRLPTPGLMVYLSPEFNPAILKGIKVHPDNPFRFDFILDRGDSELSSDQLKDESSKLIKYFLASLTIPEKDLWVNLSPYEKDRIIPQSFGLTEMGRDLLAEDYMLKQISASLIYPEAQVGKKFWKRIYEEAGKKFGTTNIPVNTFNKVWILPQKALVYENVKAGTAYIVESKLKVMLEQDYLALEKADRQASKPLNVKATQGINPSQNKDTNALGSQIVREIVIPELTREVNEDKNFSQLRQVYDSLILATWYKRKIKESVLTQVYENKNKVAGINIDDPQEKQKIYERYLKAFKMGAYNYIKEDTDPITQETMPRKYFSGGMELSDKAMRVAMITTQDKASVSNTGYDHDVIISARVDQAMQNGSSTNSTHLPLLTVLLRNLKRREDLKYLSLLPNDPNILKEFFQGQSVLNVGPEDNTRTGELEKDNIGTALLSQGINAIFLSPSNHYPQWPTGSFVRGEVQKIPFGDNKFDDVIISSLFDPSYWTGEVNSNKTIEQVDAMYPIIAQELSRVLKNNGRFFLINYFGNTGLLKALEEQGFEAIFYGSESLNAMVFINHKDAAMNARVKNDPRFKGIISSHSLLNDLYNDWEQLKGDYFESVIKAYPGKDQDRIKSDLEERMLAINKIVRPDLGDLKVLGYGVVGYVFEVEIQGKEYAIKFGASEQIKEEVQALRALKGKSLFQQYAAHDTTDKNIGWVITELMQGKHLGSSSDMFQDMSVQNRRAEALNEELKSIPPGHWDQMVEIFQTVWDLGIAYEPSPENIFYSRETGFKALDFNSIGKERKTTPGLTYFQYGALHAFGIFQDFNGANAKLIFTQIQEAFERKIGDRAQSALFKAVPGDNIKPDIEISRLMGMVREKIRDDHITDVNGRTIQEDFIRPLFLDLIQEASDQNQQVESVDLLVAMARVFNALASDPKFLRNVRDSLPVFTQYVVQIRNIVQAKNMDAVNEILRDITPSPKLSSGQFIDPQFREFIKARFSVMPQLIAEQYGKSIPVVDLGLPEVQERIRGAAIPIIVPNDRILTLYSDEQLLATSRAWVHGDLDSRIAVSEGGTIYFIKRSKQDGAFKVFYPFRLDYEDSGKVLNKVLARINIEYHQELIDKIQIAFKTLIVNSGHPDPKPANLLVKIELDGNGKPNAEFEPIDFERVDLAMVNNVSSIQLSNTGGIDLSSDKALFIQNNGQGIKFHIDPAMLKQLRDAPGFVPVIINVQPLKSLSIFLGIN